MPADVALPIRLLPSGNLATVEQDSVAEVAQSVRVLLVTHPGERLQDPELGTPDPVFDGLDGEEVTALLAEQEPRATVQIVTQQLASAPTYGATVGDALPFGDGPFGAGSFSSLRLLESGGGDVQQVRVGVTRAQ